LVLVEPILNLLQEDLLDELTFTIMPKDEKNIRRVESDSNYLTNDAKRYETVKKHALLIRSLYSKLEIKANIVVSGLTDISDCISLINWCWNNNIKPRVQRDRSYRRIDGSTRAVNILLEKLIMTPNNVVIRIPGANESCMFKNSNNQELKVKVFNQNIRLDSVCKPCNQRFTCDKSFSSLRLFEKPYSPILALCAKVDKYYAMMDLENLYRSDVVNEINYFKNNPTEYFAKFNTIFNFQ